MDELNERKQNILYAVIKYYLETGEPVGSRTISKITDLNLSSATIRNEMSDLEDLGYVVSPHTSAGRVPTDKGYRFYVDKLMAEKDKEVSEVKEVMLNQTERVEKVFKQLVSYVANATQLPTMISAPSITKNRVKFIQLSYVDDKNVLLVVVMEGNVVRNRVVPKSSALDNEAMLRLNMLLNTHLNGLTLQEINLGLVSKIKDAAGEFTNIVEEVLNTIADTISEDDLEIYTSGATNIFKYPELSDSRRASAFLDNFEDKEDLADLINEVQIDSEKRGTGLQVYIGDEAPSKNLKDCSLVTATYDLGNGVKGTIGIIGPKRMDYENVMTNLSNLKSQLENTLKRSDDNEPI
ncbi:MAG: heat-inducible transcriptional repressor HrcA [Lachnospiraceae bacterium]|nr:heat-inducible transcriptional repressor HrcA [Lachnospiraceae bacterium]